MANYIIYTNYGRRLYYKEVTVNVTFVGTLEIKDEKTKNIIVLLAHGIWEKVIWSE